MTDSLFVPLLIGAAVGWDRFAVRPGPAGLARPRLHGPGHGGQADPVARRPVRARRASCRVPAGYGTGARRCRDGLRYLGIALAAFLVPNLPYLAAAPGRVAARHPHPARSHTVPAGPGPDQPQPLADRRRRLADRATTSPRWSSWPPPLACYVRTYPALKPAAFLLPSVALFFAARSFGSYLVMLVPSALAAAATVRRPRGLAAGGTGSGSWPAAGRRLRGRGHRRAHRGQPADHVDRVGAHDRASSPPSSSSALSVTNNTAASVGPPSPSRTASSITAFWQPGRRPAVLGAAPAGPVHDRGAELLRDAVHQQRLPGAGASRQTRRRSAGRASYLASHWRVVLQPATINAARAPSARQITVHAQIVNRLDQPVRAASVPVYLGQVIYAQQGLQYSQAYINSGLAGQTPIRAAHRRQRAWRPSSSAVPGRGSDPVYFEANLVKPDSVLPLRLLADPDSEVRP